MPILRHNPLQTRSARELFCQFVPGFILVACSLLVTVARAQSPKIHSSAAIGAHGVVGAPSSNLLRELDKSLQDVVAKTSPAVVQIMVAGYGPQDDHGHAGTARMVRQHAMGSGIVVDPDGYIITNAHVVQGAQRIRVILPPHAVDSPLELQPIRAAQILDARIVGKHKDSDIALVKVEAKNLPSLPLRSNVPVHQGELVFAIGSPEGLQDSVTLGVVSAVTRQVDPENPMVYIQTDAAVNSGNSGGPLVDIDGNVVGMNTLILSAGGGSEGLGFAIPAAIVNFDYQNLRKFGRVQHVTIGVRAQNITPTLAAGLQLARSWGTIISDVTPGGEAEAAGVKTQDIVLAVDHRPILGLPDFVAALYLHSADKVLSVDVLRGASRISFNVAAVVHHDELSDLADVAEEQQSLIRRLGVFVTDLGGSVGRLLRPDRSESGVVVVAEAAGPSPVETGLEVGDIIRAVDRMPLKSVSQLRAMVHNLISADPVVLQVERDGKLQYLAFEMD